MNELIKMISQKTGVSEEIAKTAAETVIGFIKGKLPAEFAGQLDSLVEGGSLDMSKFTGGLDAEDALKGIGKLFNKD